VKAKVFPAEEFELDRIGGYAVIIHLFLLHGDGAERKTEDG
jgi:hypothetical protein